MTLSKALWWQFPSNTEDEMTLGNRLFLTAMVGLSWWLSGKESTCNVEDRGIVGLITTSGRSPGVRNATSSSILAWRIPWTEELQSMGLQRVGHDWVRTHTPNCCVMLPLSQDLLLKLMVLPVLQTEAKVAREFAGESPKWPGTCILTTCCFWPCFFRS